MEHVANEIETVRPCPAHPCLWRLFAALPDTAQRGGRLETIPGGVPRLDESFSGCRFADRCPEVMPVCR